MAMILDAFMSKCSTLLADLVQEEVIMVLGVKGELEKLMRKMRSIQLLLKDAERRKINEESSIENWLSELKDVMYEADDIIDLCRIEGSQLLADPNRKSERSPVCCNFSRAFSCFYSVPLRHEIGKRIKELNDRLNLINEERKQFKLEKSEIIETPQITLVNRRQTSSIIDPSILGGEVEAAANELVDLLIVGKLEEKSRIIAVTGMGGIGKTTLAQIIFNHPKVQTYFNINVWICISQTYSEETELLKQVIRGVKGNYGDANTKSELQLILRNSLISGQTFFLVLDDVWRADVWIDLFRAPLYNSNTCVLVTTRYENVAKVMKATYIHNVMKLSIESSWDMLRKLLFSDGEEQLANDLKELGCNIVQRCGGLPLAIKAIAGVLETRERNRKEWERILRSDVWSIRNLHEDHIAALHLSFEDLPSHLKQCFLSLSLFSEDVDLFRYNLIQLWVAEGFVEERQGSLMEDSANEYLNELIKRNLLLPHNVFHFEKEYKMHDLVRSLILYLSKEETFCGDVSSKNSNTSRKLLHLSVMGKNASIKILDSVANQGALRTLIVVNSELVLDDEKLRGLSSLRVLDIRLTKIEKLPNYIETLVHLRYLNLSSTNITTIPESIKYLTYLQFLIICYCKTLTQLPNGITQLFNLRCLNMDATPISTIPKGIKKMEQLNELIGFVATKNDSTSSKLEDLSSLKQLRMLEILLPKNIQIGANILKELSNLYFLVIRFLNDHSESDMEEQQLVEKPLDELIPPHSLEELYIHDFFGHHYPKWMALASFNNYTPNLTKLSLYSMPSCTQLPPLGHLLNLREVVISNASKVKEIGPEFLGGDVNSTTRIVFPKLEILEIINMGLLEDWTFGTQVEENASSRLKFLPCLQKLCVTYCPSLKQLPKGLKHSAMKSLELYSVSSLKSLDDLPVKLEELKIEDCPNLEKICCLPMLKVLLVHFCPALSYVEKLDALQKLEYNDAEKNSLPEWLLMLLLQRLVENDTNPNFLLQMNCTTVVLQQCLIGGSYWDLIQRIPRVIIASARMYYLRYNKRPYSYNTNLHD